MEITYNDIKTTVYLSEQIIKELNNKLNRINSDNKLINPYSVDKVIISVKNSKFEFEISLNENKNKKELLNIEQIIHIVDSFDED